ncbi:MAG: helix-turn-helix domain-containing protein [Dysgonamonadaceae bacterium]|jgi:transcriptional regulator with XRE-family HTH domain|nr:helix-turn-helix domain-containing protein [Dysgonamonadaceae bacterium]
MNIRNLEELVEKSKLTKQEISDKCGFSRPTLDSALRGADVKISTILSLAKFFKVPISYFFEDAPNGITQTGKGNVIGNSNRVMVSDCENKLEMAQKEIEHYKELLEEKERTIQILMNK